VLELLLLTQVHKVVELFLARLVLLGNVGVACACCLGRPFVVDRARNVLPALHRARLLFKWLILHVLVLSDVHATSCCMYG